MIVVSDEDDTPESRERADDGVECLLDPVCFNLTVCIEEKLLLETSSFCFILSVEYFEEHLRIICLGLGAGLVGEELVKTL